MTAKMGFLQNHQILKKGKKMTEVEIFDKLKEIIIDIKEEEMNIEKDTALIETEIFDSLELINYLTQIEEVFGLNISLEELIEKKLGVLENMIKYISEKA